MKPAMRTDGALGSSHPIEEQWLRDQARKDPVRVIRGSNGEPHTAAFDGMSWALPGDGPEDSLERRLRYGGPPSRGDVLHCTSIIECYRELIRMSERDRRPIIRALKVASGYTKRGAVMNPPASAARGAEAGNRNTPHRDGLGASPRGAKRRPRNAPPLP